MMISRLLGSPANDNSSNNNAADNVSDNDADNTNTWTPTSMTQITRT